MRRALGAMLLAGCAQAPATIGVGACDEYLARGAACVAQLGPSTVPGQSLGGKLAMQRKIWAASDRASLASLCADARAEAQRVNPACAW